MTDDGEQRGLFELGCEIFFDIGGGYGQVDGVVGLEPEAHNSDEFAVLVHHGASAVPSDDRG